MSSWSVTGSEAMSFKEMLSKLEVGVRFCSILAHFGPERAAKRQEKPWITWQGKPKKCHCGSVPLGLETWLESQAEARVLGQRCHSA